MGWSISVAEPDIRRIFRKLKKQYKLTHPESPHPTVLLQYEGDDIDVEIKRWILLLFPESVYVNFIPDTVFPSPQPVIEVKREP